MRLFWVIAIVLDVTFAQSQGNNHTELCPLLQEELNKTLVENKDKCIGVVSEKGDRLLEEILKLANDLKTRDAALEQRLQKMETEAKARDENISKLLKYINEGKKDAVVSNQTVEVDKCKSLKDKIGSLTMTKARHGAYHFNMNRLSWKNAQEFCKSHGMSLLTINTQEEMQYVKRAKPIEDRYYWVGASDVGGSPGDFYWNDGRKVDNNWRNDKMNYSNGILTCLDLGEKLGDDPCSKKLESICEVAPADVHCI